jgi:hypothetical protein
MTDVTTKRQSAPRSLTPVSCLLIPPSLSPNS